MATVTFSAADDLLYAYLAGEIDHDAAQNLRIQLDDALLTRTPRTLVLDPNAYPSALVLANFKDKDVDTLLDLMKQAQVNIPLKALVTPSNKNWVFGDLLAHLQEEHTAFTAAKETAHA